MRERVPSAVDPRSKGHHQHGEKTTAFAGREVALRNADGVSRGRRIGDWNEHIEDPLEREMPRARVRRLSSLAEETSHHHEQDILVPADLVDGRECRIADRGEGLRLDAQRTRDCGTRPTARDSIASSA